MSKQVVSKFLNQYFKNRPFFLGLFRAKELEILYSKLSKLPRDRELKILDYGCGDGFFTDILFQSLPKDFKSNVKLVGLDIGDDIVKEAKGLDIYDEIVIFDSHKIPFKDGEFDYVISNSVMEHVVHIDENISEISRVMKENATFFCTIMVDTWWRENLFGTKILGPLYRRWMKGMQYVAHSLNHEDWQKKFADNDLHSDELIGYLDKKTSMLSDLAHYFSIHSLIYKKLFNRWEIFPFIYDLIPYAKAWSGLIAQEVNLSQASGIYFELRKHVEK
ncbi:class I SAM-dependent methyltransferase [Candidatus Dojkabacteria bacterium]|uniref:Class I SAM-dependent methyltransferase n=1 Tax=Candidatus Dojkabacteria bacterium TaxID=2099670 RepID=A0A955L4F9_9BACT|nr:class I SAM-dependent methyltransferase [Candidatus Dojkabacteria bacterium]